MKHKVKLIYFKQSGKYYSEGEYETEKEWMFEIFKEVRDMVGRLPGLCPGNQNFIVHVESPTHPNNYPGLIL